MILGVDNDPFLCNLSTPQLSGIVVFPERIEYEPTVLLDRLMKGGCAVRKPRLYEPRVFVIRQSTEVSAMSNPHVASLSRLIRKHACEPVGIEELILQVPVSRSAGRKMGSGPIP